MFIGDIFVDGIVIKYGIIGDWGDFGGNVVVVDNGLLGDMIVVGIVIVDVFFVVDVDLGDIFIFLLMDDVNGVFDIDFSIGEIFLVVEYDVMIVFSDSVIV